MQDFFSSPYSTTLIQLALLNIVALVAPGPDFAVVTRNSIVYDRTIGIFTALGITLGELFHLSYIILGAHVFIVNNIWVLTLVKVAGCSYLLYLGIKMLLAKKDELHVNLSSKSNHFSIFKAMQTGALTNILNPKAIIFFISIFSVVIDADTPLSIMMIYAIVILSTTFVWFAIVAIFFTHTKIRTKLLAVKHWIERITGGLLIMISVKLALTKEY